MNEYDVRVVKWVAICLIGLFTLATVIGSVRAHYNAQIQMTQIECEARQ